MLHTTAAYLPEKLQPEEAAGFRDLVSSAVNLYPGDGGRRIQNPSKESGFVGEDARAGVGARAQGVFGAVAGTFARE